MKNISKKRRAYMVENLGYDYIIDEYESSEFYEMTISYGGDVMRYRCYGHVEEEFALYAK